MLFYLTRTSRFLTKSNFTSGYILLELFSKQSIRIFKNYPNPKVTLPFKKTTEDSKQAQRPRRFFEIFVPFGVTPFF